MMARNENPRRVRAPLGRDRCGREAPRRQTARRPGTTRRHTRAKRCLSEQLTDADPGGTTHGRVNERRPLKCNTRYGNVKRCTTEIV